MHKKLNYINLILLIMLTLSFVILIMFGKINILSISSLAFIALIILLVLTIKDIKKESTIKYNLTLLFTSIMTLIIVLRSLYDKMLSFNSFDAEMFFQPNSFGAMGTTFLDYNMGFITVMYIGLLLYKIINKKEIQ